VTKRLDWRLDHDKMELLICRPAGSLGEKNTMIREIGRHSCAFDSGRRCTVIEYQRYRVWKPLNGRREAAPMSKEFRLSDGRDVDPLSAGAFRIVLTDEIIRRNG
jgi:hypothetical protein